MKRTTLALILLAILVASCLMLTACDIFGHSCNFGEWTVTKQPTCTEEGQRERFCSCGESEKEIIPASHSYTSIVTAPTCTEQGYTTYTCACGDSYVDTYVDAESTSHSYSSVVTDPTCTEQGYTTHTCHCGDSYVDTYVDAFGVHNFQQSDTCEYCGQNIADVAVEAFDMSATEDDNVMGYAVPRLDGNYDAYIKGIGAMKQYEYYETPFKNSKRNLANAYIGEGVTTIGNYAFYLCNSLTSVVIPDSVTTIGSSAFYNCGSLISVAFGENSRLTTIGYFAFYECTSLTSITIPDSLTSTGQSVFSGCSSLTSVVFEDNSKLTYLSHRTFHGCSSLESIVIPESVTMIGGDVFSGCSSLKSVTFEDTTNWYITTDLQGCANSRGGTNISVTDALENAIYLASIYDQDYYWYKK